MKYFKASEFPEKLSLADPVLIENLIRLREYLNRPMFPSPVPGALARTDDGASESEHYAVGRLSRAVDFFCDMDPFEAYVKIVQSGLFPRIGIYFDTWFKHQKWVMFHVDLKPKPLLWFRNDKKYFYSAEPLFFKNLFKNFFLNMEK